MHHSFSFVKLLNSLVYVMLMGSAVGQACGIQFVDAKTADPIPGLIISIRSHQDTRGIQRMTNHDGFVFLDSSWSKSQVLWIKNRGMGYEESEQKVQGFICGEMVVIRLKTKDLETSEVVVTASHQEQSIDQSVQIVRVIDEKKIQAMGAISLVEALGNELNIQLSRDNVLGSGVSIQGLAGQNVKILIDGVPVLGRLDGNIDISQINMANVERIEIIEGPMSVNFGSDALAGTINIITKKSANDGWHANAKLFYESLGNYNGQVALRATKKKSTFGVDFARYFFEGWNPNQPFLAYPRTTLADTNRVHQWNPKEQYFGTIFYKYDNRKFSSTTSYNYYNEKITNRGRPTLPNYATAFDDTYITYRQSLTNETTWSTGKSWRINSVSGFSGFERRKNTFFVDLTELNPLLVGQESMHDTTRMFQILNRTNAIRYSESGKLSYELGYEFSAESMLGKRILDGQQNMWYADAYSTLEWSPNKAWSIKPGIRYGHNSAYQSRPVVSLQTRYAWKKWIAKATFGTGFRAPSIKELHFEFIDVNHNIVGNPELSAEHSWNAQMSLSNRIKMKESVLRLEAKSFFNRLFNQIQLANVIGTTEYTYFNLANAITTGGSLSATYTLKSLQIRGGAAYTAYNQSLGELDLNRFLGYVEFNGSASYRLEKQQATINIFYRSTGRQPFFYTNTDGELDRGTVSPFHFLDLTVVKSSQNKSFDFTLGVRNLLNVRTVPIAGSLSSGAHSTGMTQMNLARGTSIFCSIAYQLNHKKSKP